MSLFAQLSRERRRPETWKPNQLSVCIFWRIPKQGPGFKGTQKIGSVYPGLIQVLLLPELPLPLSALSCGGYLLGYLVKGVYPALRFMRNVRQQKLRPKKKAKRA